MDRVSLYVCVCESSTLFCVGEVAVREESTVGVGRG